MKRVKCGIDNIDSVASVLEGARLGLMTNPTGVDGSLQSTADILASRFRLSALFSCEHGIRGCVPAGEHVDCFTDARTGVPVYSCYGSTQTLTPEMLDCFDVFVYDIQDAGARFYTYIYSLANAMEACAAAGKPVVVLDRPAPLDGLTVQGTLLEPEVSSFVGRFPMPTRYALTVGEYARWVNAEENLRLDLYIAPLSGWTRDMRYGETGLLFVPPSPNISTLHALEVYTGTCIFEGTNISEGRGTALPFEYIGAPFLDAEKLARRMNELRIAGFLFREAYFSPSCSKHAGARCAGVQIYITDFKAADPVRMGLKLLDIIRELAGNSLEWTGEGEIKTIDRLLGTAAYRRGQFDADSLMAHHAPEILAWQKRTEQYRLY